MTRKKLNTIFLFVIAGILSVISIGYSALQKDLMVSGDVSYLYNSRRLYDVLRREAQSGSGLAIEYTGAHQDSMAGVGSKKIYHWYGSNDTNGTAILDKNNVIFAGHCWQMIRTTDTGGVKMIYNGEVEDGKCLNTRGNHVGYAERTTQSLSTTYYYGTDYTYDKANNVFSLSGTTSTGEIKVGEYTCKSTTVDGTCTTLYLVDTLNSGTTYNVLPLNGNSHYSQFGTLQFNQQYNSPSYVGYMYNTVYPIQVRDITNSEFYNNLNYTYTYGDSYRHNENGTYTINSPTTINSNDLNTSYSNVKNKYVCRNAVNDTCNDLWYVTDTYATNMLYVKVSDDYKYAKSYTWDGNKYVLDDNTSVNFWNIVDNANQESINNAHYTCWNDTGECTSVSYIYDLSNVWVFYVDLTDGKSIADAVNEMLYNDDVNAINSTIKTGVDSWYKKYLLNYSEKLEDTIFCNDRSQNNADTNAWNPNGGSIFAFMSFKEYSITNDLSCTNITDQFSISNNKAKLTYKIGLMSSPEMNILNNDNARKTGKRYWLASPAFFSDNIAVGRKVYTGGHMGIDSYSHMDKADGIRPAISLVPGTKYSSGTGTMEDPYVVSNFISNTRFQDSAIENGTRNVTITFPNGCSNGLTCSYKKDNGSSVNVTSTSVVVPFTSAGYLTTSIDDSYNNITLTNSHQVKFNKLYVKSDGNDSTGVGSIASPYVTLTKAYNMAEDTSTIYVMDNITYNETTSFDDNKNITLTSCTKESDTSCPTSTANSIIRGSALTNSIIKNKNGKLGLNTITLDGNNITSTQAMILNDDSLTIGSSATLKNSKNSSNGGAIINNNELVINGGIFTSNQAGSGGGIFNNDTTTITSGTFNSNSATSYGGAVFNETGSIRVVNGSFTGNKGTYGGAIFNNRAEITIENGTFTNNTATTQGGALRNNNVMTIKTGTFSSNSAPHGGAISVNTNATLTINGGTYTKNSATTGSGGVAYCYGTCNVSAGTFGGSAANKNTSKSAGGAFTVGSAGKLILTGGSITYNQCTDSAAGAIYNTGETTISNTTISNNSSSSNGGAIYSTKTLTINSGTFNSNTTGAQAGNGGFLYVAGGTSSLKGGTYSGNTSLHGGVVFTVDGSTLNISGGTYTKNKAGGTSGESGSGGVIHNYGTCTISAGTFGGSSANSNTARQHGGVLKNWGTTNVTGGTFSYNTAQNGGGISTEGTSDGTRKGTLTINGTNAKISYNTAVDTGSGDYRGGGLYAGAYGEITLQNGTVDHNTAPAGGGIYGISNSKITVSGGTISNNTASTGNGGGIGSNGTTVMSGGTIASNTAGANGGGIRVGTGSFKLSGGTIKKNRADTDGGVSKHNSGTYTRTAGYVCKNNNPTNDYDVTATSNSHCS